MSKSAVIGVVVALIVLAGGGVLLAKNSDKETNDDTKTSKMDMSKSSSSSNTATSSTPAASTSNSVTIENFAFSPAAITVKKGTTVTWTNKDSAMHTVTETDGQDGPKSGDLATGKSYTFTFDKVGTYKYDCSIHTSMTGTVTVTE